jgi:hypothetical protein
VKLYQNKSSSFDKGLEETNTIIVEKTPCHDRGSVGYSLDECDYALCDNSGCSLGSPVTCPSLVFSHKMTQYQITPTFSRTAELVLSLKSLSPFHKT